MSLLVRQKPRFCSYRALDSQMTFNQAENVMKTNQRVLGAVWWRLTQIGALNPVEGYPAGLYLEGWDERPDRPAPFTFPVPSEGRTEMDGFFE